MKWRPAPRGVGGQVADGGVRLVAAGRVDARNQQCSGSCQSPVPGEIKLTANKLSFSPAYLAVPGDSNQRRAVVGPRRRSVSCATDRSVTVWAGAADPERSLSMQIWRYGNGRPPVTVCIVGHIDLWMKRLPTPSSLRVQWCRPAPPLHCPVS